jgi:hypothetical protein
MGEYEAKRKINEAKKKLMKRNKAKTMAILFHFCLM